MNFQIGKNGITDGTLSSLRMAFKTHKSVRISILQNFAPTKDKVRMIGDELVLALGEGYRYTSVGFTIILRKGMKPSK